MPEKDLGKKYVCFKCGARFYDLRRPEPICPKCGADQRECPVPKSNEVRRQRSAAKAAPVVEPLVPLADLEGEESEFEDFEDESVEIEDNEEF
ncbi:MAG: FYDLN acid domain-containing protein [Cystobacterineae bacterium]|nr:FYDLN acid domain-containing protein [Cystobacterineae bacterium]